MLYKMVRRKNPLETVDYFAVFNSIFSWTNLGCVENHLYILNPFYAYFYYITFFLRKCDHFYTLYIKGFKGPEINK